jgi:hypothetical protein
MTPEEITRRNRANATRSTGPRSEAGKAIVAQNARRHGATARPDPDQVLTWLRLILADPDLGAADMFARDERTYVALALAEAEVRYAAAGQAVRDFEAGEAEPSDSILGLENTAGLITEHLEFADLGLNAKMGLPEVTRTDRRECHALIARIDRMIARETANQQRLLHRYLGEARARRNKAFQAWIACLQGVDHRLGSAEEADSRNKARFN